MNNALKFTPVPSRFDFGGSDLLRVFVLSGKRTAPAGTKLPARRASNVSAQSRIYPTSNLSTMP
jgi:hypothetical protein